MYCSSCGRTVSPRSYCNYCGVKAPDADHDYPTHSAKPAAKTSSLVLVLIGALVGGVLAVGGLVLGIHFADRSDQANAARREAPDTTAGVASQSPSNEAPPSRTADPAPPPADPGPPPAVTAPAPPPANHSYNANQSLGYVSNTNVSPELGRTIVDQTFQVAPGRFNYFQFGVGRDGMTVSGLVRASGGRDDIQTLIIPALEMENFRNDHRFRSFYDSGWVTVGQINVRLPAGDYYPVFSNSRSIVTNKVVTAQVTLHE